MNISRQFSVSRLKLNHTSSDIIEVKQLRRSRFDERDSYQELQSLGHGGNGNCYLLRRRSDQALRVCKIINRFHEKEPWEATILFNVLPRHHRILELYEVTIHARTFQLYFDYYSGGDLAYLIQGIQQVSSSYARVAPLELFPSIS